ncbi:hypothetical protein ABGB05_00640 [Plantactinospora sp. B5E13]
MWNVPTVISGRNQRPAWDGPTGFGHRVGRAGRLTPAQQARAGAHSRTAAGNTR